MSVWEQAEADQKLWDIVKEELDKGTIKGYGKELLQSTFVRRAILLLGISYS
jgi:hypothetical protein